LLLNSGREQAHGFELIAQVHLVREVEQIALADELSIAPNVTKEDTAT
jgi:hypothetical protein